MIIYLAIGWACGAGGMWYYFHISGLIRTRFEYEHRDLITELEQEMKKP